MLWTLCPQLARSRTLAIGRTHSRRHFTRNVTSRVGGSPLKDRCAPGPAFTIFSSDATQECFLGARVSIRNARAGLFDRGVEAAVHRRSILWALGMMLIGSIPASAGKSAPEIHRIDPAAARRIGVDSRLNT